MPDAALGGGHELRCQRGVCLKNMVQCSWTCAWQKGVKRNTPCFLCIGSFAGVCSGLVKGSQIFRELGFAHLVGVEHGIGKCCNICQL